MSKNLADAAEWVDNDQRLSELCLQWRQQSRIALDTEFIRTRTFFPHIGLLQVADSEGIYLVDPLAINDKSALRDVLSDSNVVKIIHSCSEDLETFKHYLGVLPAPLFDTQVAAAFVGLGSSISYANLVLELIGDSIPKQETRSDWMQRPLSQSQLHYAALDVEHLLTIETQLCQRLNDKQRLPWVQLECQQLLEKISANDNIADYYLRIKSAWKLQPKQLAVLKALCQWREQEARSRDIPRNRLVKDSSLLEVARVLPKQAHDLFRLRDMHPRFVNRYGDHCINLITAALAATTAYPDTLPAPLSSEQTTLFKQLKQAVVAIAETLVMPPEYLARKKDIEALAQQLGRLNIDLPAGLQGWREEVVGKILIEQMVKAAT